MPKRVDLRSVLVIGSGPIVIGQACEFDYSGTQALRVMQKEGVRVILINSNPATIMTDPEFADATYIEPLTDEVVEAVIAKERPDALLPTLGGQVALNLAMQLHERGVLAKYGVELIGARAQAIARGEDRQQFKELVTAAGAEVARSGIARTLEQAQTLAEELGYPVVARPSYTMGGLGSGLAYGRGDLDRIVGLGLSASPTGQVLLEESILGWKEYELELMRDGADNTVVVCSIENIDPVGVHTGDSLTVAPAMTLTDREYQNLRDVAIDIIRRVGVDTGGCNIQFAVNPSDGRVIVIEMNPRVSRSSALASKATGFPIAKIAAKLALGYRLDEIPNDITQKTPASFEPALDYVVVKAPRFAFEKFPTADSTLATAMKSVGEAMAIGRNFTQALQKVLRSLEQRDSSFYFPPRSNDSARLKTRLLKEIERPTARRLVLVQQALWHGAGPDEINLITGLDPWYLAQIELINRLALELEKQNALGNPELLARAKAHGFSDLQIGQIYGVGEEVVRERRIELSLHPVYKSVDTCAGEFPATTPYYYSSYDGENEVLPSDKPKVIILGSGPNRIGQGVEFDYSCVHAAFALSAKGYETVMINCNPETVSTDYDTSGRLYFEPLTLEDVLEVIWAEQKSGRVLGVIVQLGGQTPLKLARSLQKAGVKILGTSPEAIDLAENRDRFSMLLKSADLLAPAHGLAQNLEQAKSVAERIGYPVLVRPSFVLGGQGMEIIYDRQGIDNYFLRLGPEKIINSERPLLVDSFLNDAIEIDVDALFDGKDLFVGGIMEHIEEAGVHSGDSSCTIPPVTLGQSVITEVLSATRSLAQGLGVRGALNIQFAVAGSRLYVLEANPRASRTVPFAAKALGVPLAKAASRIMLGESIARLRAEGLLPEADAASYRPQWPVAVKEAVLPFKRFRTPKGRIIDSVLGPEMRSTGEVMGIDKTFPKAFAKSQQAAYGALPTSGTVFISVADSDKRAVVMPASRLCQLGFRILATSGTASVLHRHDVPAEVIARYSQTRLSGEKSVVELIEAGQIDIVINTPGDGQARADGYEIRAAATGFDLPLVTTVAQMTATVMAIESAKQPLEVTSLQEYQLRRKED